MLSHTFVQWTYGNITCWLVLRFIMHLLWPIKILAILLLKFPVIIIISMYIYCWNNIYRKFKIKPTYSPITHEYIFYDLHIRRLPVKFSNSTCRWQHGSGKTGNCLCICFKDTNHNVRHFGCLSIAWVEHVKTWKKSNFELSYLFLKNWQGL